jgi:predicted kinase
LISKFRYNKELFKYVQILSIADSNGRYYDEEVVKHHKEMPIEVFNEIYDCIASERERVPVIGKPTCTLLIGSPLSGNIQLDLFVTRLLEEFEQFEVAPLDINVNEETVIVSRDTILVDYGNNNNLGKTYPEIWGNLSDTDQKNIDVMTQTRFNTAIKAGKNIVIDMANMSKKARNRWISNLPKYYVKKAVVMLTSYDELKRRNGKDIPEYVIKNMAKSFATPMYDEFDVIEYMFNGEIVKDKA